MLSSVDREKHFYTLSHGTSRDTRGRKAVYAGMTEDAPALDIRRLGREGLLVPGRCFGMTWPGERTRYFYVTASLDALHLGDAILPLAWTPCTFGGRRPWFICPARDCRRCVALLYGRPAFLCRHCRGLTFRSRRLDLHDRALLRAEKLRVRLGGTPAITAPIPLRPKGMHHWTYTRQGIAIVSAELKASRAALARLGCKPSE